MQSVRNPLGTAPQRPEDEQAAPAVVVDDARGEGVDVFDAVWRFFCSTRLALIIILLLAAGTLAGTLLVQAPQGLGGDPIAYAQWLPKARAKYGVWTDLLSFLRLLDVFGSIWYRLLLAGLTINIVVCTVNRWNGLWRSVAKPRVRMGEGFFRRASHSAVFSSNGAGVEATASAVGSVFTGHGYRLLREEDGGSVYMYADRNRFGKLGTILNHLSLVLILGGAIAGGMLGFRDKEFMIPVGSERALGHGTNLTMRVNEFIDEYYPEGPPKDFRSDVVLFDGGNEVARKTIRVNDPLEYQGIRFYQAFFGPSAVLEVKDANGNLVFKDGVALAYRSREERPLGSFDLPDSGLQVWVVAPVSGRADPLVPAGQVRLEIYRLGSNAAAAVDNLTTGRPKKVGDLEYTFVREVQFTGLQVAKDPGTPVIWLASALMVVGLAMVFYFPHRRIWAVCKLDQEQRPQVVLGATGRRDMGLEEEFRRVAGAIKSTTVALK